MVGMEAADERCIGVVGLGMMGQPIAARLAEADEQLVLFDIDTLKAAEAAERTGGVVADSLTGLGEKCNVVITLLPNSEIVGQALFGSKGLSAGLRPGSLVIEMSSGQPKRTAEFGRRLAGNGIAMVDAPVSGGVSRAVMGELAIMVGGEDADCEIASKVLRHLGTTILRTGALGSGQAMKALNNLVSAGGFLIAAEALRVGQEFGLNPETIVDALNASTGMNNSTKNKLKQHVLAGTFASGFALNLMVKDLGIALTMAEDMRLNVPFARLCRDHWAAGAEALGPGSDHTSLARFVDKIAYDQTEAGEGVPAGRGVATAEARWAAEAACRDLVIRMVHASDHGEAEVATDLFVTVGSWLRGGKLLEGREAIRASFEGRGGHIVRHVVAATMVDIDDPDHARGVSYYVAYRGERQVAADVPLLLEPPFSMGEWHDRFVRTASGWRFAHREVRRLFQGRQP